MPSRALDEQLAVLRARADAYRSQAIALDAKLRVLAACRSELNEVRSRLLETSARLDSAVRSLVSLGHRPRLRARGTGRR